MLIIIILSILSFSSSQPGRRVPQPDARRPGRALQVRPAASRPERDPALLRAAAFADLNYARRAKRRLARPPEPCAGRERRRHVPSAARIGRYHRTGAKTRDARPN